MLLYLAADLMWASKIRSTADAIGVQARPVRSMEMLQARLADSPVRALMVDLEAGSVAIEMIRHVRGLSDAALAGMPILAFGPHVNVDALAAAKSAGASAAVARGGLQADLAGVMARLVAGKG